jgi:hypothetical protein
MRALNRLSIRSWPGGLKLQTSEILKGQTLRVSAACCCHSLPMHRELARRFLFQTIHDVTLMLDRERAGREASPSAGVIDSQSIKAPRAKTRAYDAGKRIVGRKCHIAVDTDERLLMVNLTTVDISDSAGAQAILDSIPKPCRSLLLVIAGRNSAFSGRQV